jgi:hypothetical protein
MDTRFTPNRLRTYALPPPPKAHLQRCDYGTTAVAWFESTLSTLLELTDVTT